MSRTAAIVIVAALAAGTLAFVVQLRRAELTVAGVAGPAAARPPSITETIAASPAVARSPRIDFLRPQPIGEGFSATDRPMIANVAIIDLDADGLADVVAADAATNRVTWVRQSPAGDGLK